MNRRVALTCLLAATLLGPRLALAQGSETFTLNGYSSFEFEKRLTDQGRGDPNGSFDADLLDLVVNFKPDSRLRVAADLTWEHGAATEDGRGNVAVEYGLVEYAFHDWLRLRAGKMFTAFGIYNEIHTAKPAFLTVKEPFSTNKNDKFGSDLRLYPRWMTGLAVLGDAHFGSVDADYVVQVGNGDQTATNPFEEDDNTAKSVTARVRVRPTRQLTLGASLYRDSMTEYTAEGEDSGGRTHLTSYGAQLEWVPSALGFELEYVHGSLDPSQLSSLSQDALTAMAYYRIRDRFTPYFRYERLDPDSTISDDVAQLYVYGLNIHVLKGFYLKTEFDTVTAGSQNTRFEGQGYTEFKAAAVVGF
jgi:hypothetical protein